MTGVIKRLVRDKGFGFVREEAGGVEYFFHRSEVAEGGPGFDGLTEGDRVAFDEAHSEKGPRAANVERY